MLSQQPSTNSFGMTKAQVDERYPDHYQDDVEQGVRPHMHWFKECSSSAASNRCRICGCPKELDKEAA